MTHQTSFQRAFSNRPPPRAYSYIENPLYSFNFFIDGTVSSYVSGSTVYGTWESTGTANDISVIIDIPGLPLCNNIWHLQEIDENDEDTKIDLRLSDANRLRYENTCN